MISKRSLHNVIKLLRSKTFYKELNDNVKTGLKNSIKYYLDGSDSGTMFYEKMLYIITDSNYLNSKFHFTKNEINEIINYLSENIDEVKETLNSNSKLFDKAMEKLDVE